MSSCPLNRTPVNDQQSTADSANVDQRQSEMGASPYPTNPKTHLPPPMPPALFKAMFQSHIEKENISYNVLDSTFKGHVVDLASLHREVMNAGGSLSVTDYNLWPVIGVKLGFPQVVNTEAGLAGAASEVAGFVAAIYAVYLEAFDRNYIKIYSSLLPPRVGLAPITLVEQQNVAIFVANFKGDYKRYAETSTNLRIRMDLVLEEEWADFRLILDRTKVLCDAVDELLPLYGSPLMEDAVRRLVAIIIIVQRQKALLCRSNSAFIVDLPRLKTMEEKMRTAALGFFNLHLVASRNNSFLNIES